MKNVVLFLILILVLSCNNLNRHDNLLINQKGLDTFNSKKNSKNVIGKNSIIQNQILIYGNDSINAIIYLDTLNLDDLKFQLSFKNYSNKIEGVANLVLLEDKFGRVYVPEGSAILDEKKDEEYFCDKTYSYQSGNNYKLSISLEKDTKQRISLIIYKSKIKELNNGFFTLYKTDQY